MTGKYSSPLRFNLVRAQRLVLRSLLRPLLRWQPLREPRNGYTILIGCSSPLAPMLLTNLLMLSRQKRDNLDRIIVVFDRPADRIGIPIEQRAREAFPALPLEFVYYTRVQAKVLAAIGWGWSYAWLSWCLGIAHTRTRYAFLQDFDAYLMQDDLIESRYALMREARVEYLGSRRYGGNGVIHDDGLVGTPELMFDAQFVREHFKPIHLFNHVCRYKGRTVDFDTFLYPQTLAGRGQVAPIPENCMVHPSQLICQFTAQMNESAYVPPTGNNLLLIPYFFSLAGDQESMRRQGDLLLEANGASVPFHGRPLNLKNLHKTHVDWITKQAYRLEETVGGAVRPEVARYFEAIARFVARKDGSPQQAPGLLPEHGAPAQ